MSVVFGPADTVPPDGFVVDSGMTPSAHDNGLTYGWSKDASRRARNSLSDDATDPRDKSNIAMRAATWTVEVPNGSYVVTVGAGDGRPRRRARLMAEDVLLLDDRTTAGQRFLEATASVNVTDGTLDLTSAKGFRGNRLTFVRLQSASTPSSGVDLGASDQPIAWSPAALPVRTPRVEAGVATIGSRLYVMGGFVQGLDVSNSSDVFDAATGTWRNGPVLRGAQTHAGTTSDNVRMIYKAGGQLGGGIPGTPTAEAWQLDTQTGRWTGLPDLPEARYAPGMAWVNGKLHVFSGTLPDRTTIATDHWVLDLNNKRLGWQTAAPIPSGGDHESVAVIGGQIYVVGGEHGHATTEEGAAPYIQHQTVLKLDPATDTWTTLADMPIGRSHAEGTTVVVDGKILFMGGKLNPTDVSDQADLYDPATNVWTSLGSLPAPIQGGSAILYDGKIYLSHGQIGGPAFTMHTQTWVGTLGDLTLADPTPPPPPTSA